MTLFIGDLPLFNPVWVPARLAAALGIWHHGARRSDRQLDRQLGSETLTAVLQV